jgi:membrane protein DedA with SNARE-associated domain
VTVRERGTRATDALKRVAPRLLSLPLAIGAGTLGAAFGDQSWFWMGRWRRQTLIARFPMMGATEIRAAKFRALNGLGASAWAALVAGGGYSFGSVVPGSSVSLQHLEAILVTTLVLACGSYWLRRHRRSKLPQHSDVAGYAGAGALGADERRQPI